MSQLILKLLWKYILQNGQFHTWRFNDAIACLWVGLRRKYLCVDCYRMCTATANHIESLRSQIYTYKYIYMYIYIYTHIFIYIYTHTHTHILHDRETLVGQKMKKYRESRECRMRRKLFRPSFWARAQ